MNVVSSKKSPKRGGTKRDDALAREAWALFQELFFSRFRPRMLALWREFDLNPPQQMTLGLLDEPRPMGELASQLQCDNSNITGIVDRLSDRGLVERRPSPGDRRVKLVALTDEGRELRSELDRRRAIPPDELLELSAADQRALRDIIGRALG